jgi:hypothetical protein
LDETTQKLMNEIASNPAEDFSYPNVTSFDDLIVRLPLILASSCFYVQSLTPAFGCGGDTIAVIGENLFATDVFLKCRFTFPSGDQVIVRGHHFNNTLMHCVVPDRLEAADSAIVEVTTDGRGFTDNGLSFQYGGNCSQHRSDDNITTFVVMTVTERSSTDWWPWLFFLLLPLLCCLLLFACCRRRRKPKEQQRAQVVSTTDTTPEEEAFQIEGLETNPVSPNSPYKWKVQPAAYIGFGKGKMDVNWNGEAPESAPHSLKRQQIPANTLEDPVEGIPLTPSLAHVAGGAKQKRGFCPWLCCVGKQDEPRYPRNEGEEQRLAASVPRVLFHVDSAHVGANTTFENKNDVEG